METRTLPFSMAVRRITLVEKWIGGQEGSRRTSWRPHSDSGRHGSNLEGAVVVTVLGSGVWCFRSSVRPLKMRPVICWTWFSPAHKSQLFNFQECYKPIAKHSS